MVSDHLNIWLYNIVSCDVSSTLNNVNYLFSFCKIGDTSFLLSVFDVKQCAEYNNFQLKQFFKQNFKSMHKNILWLFTPPTQHLNIRKGWLSCGCTGGQCPPGHNECWSTGFIFSSIHLPSSINHPLILSFTIFYFSTILSSITMPPQWIYIRLSIYLSLKKTSLAQQ